MARLRQLWTESLLFRRIVAAGVLALAAVAVSLGSHIPRSMPLPDTDLNAKAVAHLGEDQFVLLKPSIAQGDLALSYVGNKNEVAELWLDNATLDQASQRLLFGTAPAPPPGRISYTTSDTAHVQKSGDTCHTTVEVRLAKGSSPVQALHLFQDDATAGPQRFRQIVLESPGTSMELEVHTDAPEMGSTDLLGCHKLLTLGDKQTDVPSLPLHFLVSSGKIDLHFNPADPAVAIWTGPDQTFEAVSVGDGSLRTAGLQVIAQEPSKQPLLNVRSRTAGGTLTLSKLRLGADSLRLEVGRDPESAVAYVEGKSIWNYDLIAEIQKNPVLSFVFAAVLVPALWKWVQKNCLTKPEEKAAEQGKG